MDRSVGIIERDKDSHKAQAIDLLMGELKTNLSGFGWKSCKG